MADEIDRAQDCEAEFLADTLAAASRRRDAALLRLPPCENRDEGCKELVFVTEKGTRARFCKGCWEEFKADQAVLHSVATGGFDKRLK